MSVILYMTAHLIALWAGFSLSYAQDPTPDVRSTLHSRYATVKPGAKFDVAVRLAIEEKWHVYWSNPGESGMPTKVDFKLPPGWIVDNLRYPTPELFKSEAGATYGIGNEAIFLATVYVPESAPQEEVTILADVNWLACDDVCILGGAKLSLSIAVGEEMREAPVGTLQLFERAKEKIPAPPDGWSFTAVPTNQGYELKMTGKFTPVSAYFFAYDHRVVSPGAEQAFKRTPHTVELDLVKSEYADDTPERLEGVLVFELRNGEKLSVLVSVPLVEEPLGGD